MKEKNKKNYFSWLNVKKAVFVFLVFAFTIPNLSLNPPVAQADSIIPNINSGGWDRSLITAGNDQLIGLTYSLRTLLWTAGVILESSQSILTRVADTGFYQDQLGGFVKKRETGMGSAQSGWNWVKTLCNTIIVILLLFIAFGTILRVESYNYKYLLVKLIVVAILVNFSGVIAGIVLDFTHIIMGIFSDQITNIGKSIEANSKLLQEFTGTTDLSDISAVTENLGENMTRTISRVNVNLILASVLMFILGITVLAVALFLIVRTVSLWLLFTLSPLALALYVLPHTRAASLKWWDAFLRYGFAGPLLFFFLYLTVFISGNLNVPSEPTIAGPDSFVLFSNSGSFLDYLFLVVLLWASIFLSRSLSIAGAVQVVGYFRDITKGEKGIKVITKLVNQGGAALERAGGGKILHRFTGTPIAIKGDIKGPFRGGEEGVRAATKAFQPALKIQTEATRKALESLLNPQAVGRVLSIVDAKRKGGELSQFGGNLQEISKTAAMSTQDPGEFVRTLWRRFEPATAPTGSFWKDAKTLNEEINRQIDDQERVRTTFNDLGARSDKIMNFQTEDRNAREAQIYKLAWTGGLPDFFNTKLGKAYSPETLADYIKTNFGEKQGGQIAEKLKMIGEAKKDPSLSVASWNEKKSKFEVTAKPVEAPKIDPKDLHTMAPQSLLVKNEKGEYSGFNETGMQFLKEISHAHVQEIGKMRDDTVKAIAEAFKNTQKKMGNEFFRKIGSTNVSAVQAETIKAIGKAHMQGPFNVEQVQAPHAQIGLGQEFLNKIASRAFAGKKVDTGRIGIITPETKSDDKEEKNKYQTPEQKTQEAKIVGRVFAQKRMEVDEAVEPEEPEEETTNLKDKQLDLMLGNKKAAA